MSSVRRFLKAPLTAMLAWTPIRRRLIFDVRQYYYAELENQIPLGNGLSCPLAFLDAWSSFSEIFVEGEYAPAFDRVPLPERWLDLGCHAGFFSLYVAWQRAQAGLRPGTALLVDADSRMAAAVARLVERNNLSSHFRFLQGAIAPGSGHLDFRERGHMSSSISDGRGTFEDGTRTRVSVLTPHALTQTFPPPYDLVKVDIEGAEYDFATNYDAVLEATRAVLIEWHSAGDETLQVAKLCAELHRRGFGPPIEVRAKRQTNTVETTSTGLLLFIRS
jgi:FkbM family methyltransferase